METGKFDATENCKAVLARNYLRKDLDGNIVETPEQMFERVATHIASAEATQEDADKWGQKFYDAMTNKLFMPNTPTLMNAGRPNADGLLSACFVIPIGDSIDEIFNAVKATALVQKAGGGTGFSFDSLRPTGAYIRSSGGSTSGPLSFWKVFAETTNAIQQGAFRRGANMGMMSITHPDILSFIFAKQNKDAYTNFNITVKLTDKWVKRYRNNPTDPHILINNHNGKEYVMPTTVTPGHYGLSDLIPYEKYIEMAEKPAVFTNENIYDLIVQYAWNTGEPGIFFPDEVNRHNMVLNLGEIEATNPCGEQPLAPWQSCNLGSINLSAHMKDGKMDWDMLKNTIEVGVRFLDNVVDVNNYPIKEIREMSRASRNIGLGIMGFADTLFKMKIPYNSEEGLAMGEKIMKFINDKSHECSQQLATERGVFPAFEKSRWNTERKIQMRNAATTTVAPTGTISIISECSGGVEPMFSLVFTRNILDKKLNEVNRVFEDVAKERGFYSEGLMTKIATEGSIQHIDGIPEDVKRVFVCTHDISPEWHIRMQAAFQKHCDSAISKTVNLPHNAPKEVVKQIYDMAYDLKVKGVTVYRDGCRDSQPMALKSKESAETITVGTKPKRPVDVPAEMHTFKLGGVQYYVACGVLNGKLFEVFAGMSNHTEPEKLDTLYIPLKVGKGVIRKVKKKTYNYIDNENNVEYVLTNRHSNSDADALTRMVSKLLQASEYDLEDVVEILENTKGSLVDYSKVLMRQIKGYIKDGTFIKTDMCPVCKTGRLVREAGCKRCEDIKCGYSACS